VVGLVRGDSIKFIGKDESRISHAHTLDLICSEVNGRYEDHMMEQERRLVFNGNIIHIVFEREQL
jgi:hypothetical protein